MVMITIHDIILLKKLVEKYGISRASATYHGGADSGSINDIKFEFAGEDVTTIEPMLGYRKDLDDTVSSPILDRLGVDYSMELISLEQFLFKLCDKYVAQYSPRGWENNNGGGGSLIIEDGAIAFVHYTNSEDELYSDSTFKLSLPLDTVPDSVMEELNAIVNSGSLDFNVSISEDGCYELVTYNKIIDGYAVAAEWVDSVLEEYIDTFVQADFANANEDDYGNYEAQAVIKDGYLEITSELTITSCYQETSVDLYENIDELIEDMSKFNNLHPEQPLGYEFIGNTVFGLYLEDERTIKLPIALELAEGGWIDINPNSPELLEKPNAVLTAKYDLVRNKENMQPINQLMNFLITSNRDAFIDEALLISITP